MTSQGKSPGTEAAESQESIIADAARAKVKGGTVREEVDTDLVSRMLELPFAGHLCVFVSCVLQMMTAFIIKVG